MHKRLDARYQLSENIKFLRQQYNLTREKLAEYVGTTGQTIAAIEGSKTDNPGFFTIQAIANFFGLDTEELVRKDISEISFVGHTFRRGERILGDMSYREVDLILENINLRINQEAEKGLFRKIQK